MGTEVLKEQYNILMNEQKAKLEKLRQKKLSAKSVASDTVNIKIFRSFNIV
jgi:Spy/CpxP family protein refolding chaperone